MSFFFFFKKKWFSRFVSCVCVFFSFLRKFFVLKINLNKKKMDSVAQRFATYYSCFGSTHFASELSQGPLLDLELGEHLAMNVLSDREILECASHHGDIGASKKTLDARAVSEQSKVDEHNEAVRQQLL